MDGIDILNEIARIRGVGPELIHKVIHEFNWFISSIIWGEDSESERAHAVYTWGKTQKISYDGENTLNMWIVLFRKWYREVQELAFEEFAKEDFSRISYLLKDMKPKKNPLN